MLKIITFAAMVALLGLAVLVLPTFIRARNTSASNACVNNLLGIAGAKETWALENHKTTNDVVSWNDIRPYLRHPKALQCPTAAHILQGGLGNRPGVPLRPRSSAEDLTNSRNDAEPRHSADRSQPFRSGCNRRSVAAGSGR